MIIFNVIILTKKITCLSNDSGIGNDIYFLLNSDLESSSESNNKIYNVNININSFSTDDGFLEEGSSDYRCFKYVEMLDPTIGIEKAASLNEKYNTNKFIIAI